MLLGTPESLPDQPGPLRILSKEVGLCSNVANVKRYHTVNSSPQSKLQGGGLQRLLSADDVAIEWLKTYHGS